MSPAFRPLLPWLAAPLLALGLAAGAAGADAPTATLEATLFDGGAFSLEALRGKVVLVEFWSPSSLASRKSMGELQRFYADYRDRGVEVVAMSVDASDDARELLEQRGATFPAGARNAATDNFPKASGGLPVLYLVDKRGVVRGAHGGLFNYRTLSKAVDPLLEE